MTGFDFDEAVRKWKRRNQAVAAWRKNARIAGTMPAFGHAPREHRWAKWFGPSRYRRGYSEDAIEYFAMRDRQAFYDRTALSMEVP